MNLTPETFRNLTFDTLRDQLPQLRQRVYSAWGWHGPGTTRQVAKASGIDLLTLRPRTTELLQLGLVRLVTDNCSLITDHSGHEGTYEVVCANDWHTWRDLKLSPHTQTQIPL